MFKILGTEFDDGKQLIKVRDLTAQVTFLYYVEEVKHIPNEHLRNYLQKRLPFIMSGEYG